MAPTGGKKPRRKPVRTPRTAAQVMARARGLVAGLGADRANLRDQIVAADGTVSDDEVNDLIDSLIANVRETVRAEANLKRLQVAATETPS